MFSIKRLDTKPKGKLKCFTCRCAFTSRDGKWIQRDGQQIFLCVACNQKPEKTVEIRHE